MAVKQLKATDEKHNHSLVVALVQGWHEVEAATRRHPPHFPQRAHDVIRLQREVLQPWTLQATSTALGTLPIFEHA